MGIVAESPAEGDSEPRAARSTGIAAGYLDNGYRVKIGQSMNVAQRVDSFKFEELIELKPLVLPVRRPTSTRRITSWPCPSEADSRYTLRASVMATTLRPEHYQDSETGNLIVP
jgi:hypothetical protein